MSTRSKKTTPLLALIGIIVFVWTVMPIYNMVAVALTSNSAVFSSNLWPHQPTLEGFVKVFTEDHFYLEHFWRQMWNSLFIGVITAAAVLLIGTMTSFTIGRIRVRGSSFLSSAALFTYVIPMSFLAIPFYRVMHSYGLADSPWAVILVEVTFATPYAIFVFLQYSNSIPTELDEAAKIDGASLGQIFLNVYLPLMAPALVAVGTYALLLAWNEYLFAFLLLSSETTVTVPVALGFFLNSDQAPWELLMAASVVYSLPPIVIYYLFRKYMAEGLTVGGIKG
ncbi:Glycerol transport system permease protein OS=Castellaniella defragrans OX=75697 GN=HNR28_000447 PE=3 SV=1 [Castellaniella defragrans]